jgi:hypothetical protein
MRDQDLPPLTPMDGGRFSRPAIRDRLRALAVQRRAREHPALVDFLHVTLPSLPFREGSRIG